MVDLVIGDSISNLTVAVPAASRLYSPARLDVFDAQVSFRVEGCRGDFPTLLSVPIVRDFAKKLPVFTVSQVSEIAFWGGLDNEADFEITLRAKNDSRIAASVSFGLSRGKDTAHAYEQTKTMWSFQGGLYFEFARTELSRLAESLNALKLVAP